MKINLSFLKISSTSSSLPRIFASSSYQRRLFSSSAKRSSFFEFKFEFANQVRAVLVTAKNPVNFCTFTMIFLDRFIAFIFEVVAFLYFLFIIIFFVGKYPVF